MQLFRSEVKPESLKAKNFAVKILLNDSTHFVAIKNTLK
jgi:hypothetical protein